MRSTQTLKWIQVFCFNTLLGTIYDLTHVGSGTLSTMMVDEKHLKMR